MTKTVKKLLDKYSEKRFGVTASNRHEYQLLLIEFIKESKLHDGIEK